MYDNHQVEPPATPEQGYHLTEDLVDKAIQFIADAKQVAPHKPFYLHFCTGATHAPHHVAKEWADRYAGQFDDGWDAYRERVLARQKELGVMPPDAELSRRDPDVPDWDSLPPQARRLAARMMEVYAGFLSHTDHHIGRLLAFLRETGEFDNMLVMVVSDNGASAEGGPTGTTNELQFFNNAPESLEESLAKIDELGGPTTFNHYPWGWTWAGNTPFRRWKRETYRGGTADPFLVHWPAGIQARGAVRTQYAHITDMVPTVLDAFGLTPPATVRGVTQSPLHGVSFAHTFDDPAAPTRHRTQYFEMFGHRAIDHDGWRAVCPWPGPSFTEAGKPFGALISAETLTDLDAHHWELYHVAMLSGEFAVGCQSCTGRPVDLLDHRRVVPGCLHSPESFPICTCMAWLSGMGSRAGPPRSRLSRPAGRVWRLRPRCPRTRAAGRRRGGREAGRGSGAHRVWLCDCRRSGCLVQRSGCIGAPAGNARATAAARLETCRRV